MPPSAAIPVQRPADPLARGRWEAPAWAIALLSALVVLAGIGYFVRRALKSRRAGKAVDLPRRSTASVPPPSRGRRR